MIIVKNNVIRIFVRGISGCVHITILIVITKITVQKIINQYFLVCFIKHDSIFMQKYNFIAYSPFSILLKIILCVHSKTPKIIRQFYVRGKVLVGDGMRSHFFDNITCQHDEKTIKYQLL